MASFITNRHENQRLYWQLWFITRSYTSGNESFSSLFNNFFSLIKQPFYLSYHVIRTQKDFAKQSARFKASKPSSTTKPHAASAIWLSSIYLNLLTINEEENMQYAFARHWRWSCKSRFSCTSNLASVSVSLPDIALFSLEFSIHIYILLQSAQYSAIGDNSWELVQALLYKITFVGEC